MNIEMKQGGKPIHDRNYRTSTNDGAENTQETASERQKKEVQKKLAELLRAKNIHFLFGAGTSSPAVPTMCEMLENVEKVKDELPEAQKKLYKKISSGSGNLEKTLSVLYSFKDYLSATKEDANVEDLDNVEKLIDIIKEEMFDRMNVKNNQDSFRKVLEIYKKFYEKMAMRNKDLARLNVFTTNCDLFNERALDELKIDFNNGFGGGLEKAFNPARFRYTYSRKVDSNLEKYEPVERMVYLYKLHGSINWIEEEGPPIFRITEKYPVPKYSSEKKVLIYPTPLKQQQSLGTPYSDLIREFQTKLLLPHSTLLVIGYSFSDEHINSVIDQSLASNASLALVMFNSDNNQCPFAGSGDTRIYSISGEAANRKDGSDST